MATRETARAKRNGGGLMKQYDPKQDGRMSYDLCIDTLREKCIREGSVAPLAGSEKEQRWAKEGPRDFSDYDSLKTRAA